MYRFVTAQVRYRSGRAIALIGALLVAVTSFSVLTATARTQRLQVTGIVGDNERGTYDILVRPAGSTSAVEARSNLVSSTALTGLTGGITTAQWRKILALPDIDAAAPVAVVGYVLPQTELPVDLAAYLDPTASAQVFRVGVTQVSERGLTSIPVQDPNAVAGTYVYVTRNPIHGTKQTVGPETLTVPAEIDASGGQHPICATPVGNVDATTNTAQAAAALSCGSTNPDDTYNSSGPGNPKASGTDIAATGQTSVFATFPYLIEAVDPVQEARLAGLDRAVTHGTYFTAGQGPAAGGDGSGQSDAIPVLLANHTAVDEQLKATVTRLPDAAASAVAGGADADALATTLPGMAGTPVATFTIDAQQAYRTLLDGIEHSTGSQGVRAVADQYLSALPITYADQGGVLAAQALPPGSNPLLPQHATFRLGQGDLAKTGDLVDTAVRSLTQHARLIQQVSGFQYAPAFHAVGEFDPSKLASGHQGLGAVPMETYFPTQASGFDDASKKALGGRPLLPNGNIRGLLSVPPSMITTLSSLAVLDDPASYTNVQPAMGVDRAAPISVVRVRLTGALGTDALSRERVRLAAQRIHDATGLDVDVTMGSSPAPVAVTDPAGAFGRPQLTLAELWSKKGVAAVVIAAVDRKSLILFVLVLGVCGLFIAGATGAAVRSRRTELAVLACLGWPARRLFRLILAEVAAEGLLAGLLGAVLAVPIGHAIGVSVGFGRAALSIPAAVALALLAALWPAVRAARTHPGGAVAQAVSGPRRPFRLRGITGLALANLRRVPGRTALGAVALMLGVAALVALFGITTAFRGSVTGSLLGDAVTVQVRATDVAAAVIALLLGAFTVADVSYLNIRDRAAEFALLRATGWTDRRLHRLVLTEGTVMAAVGAVAGAALAVGAEAAFAGRLVPGLLVVAGLVVSGAVVFAMAAVSLPAAAIHRESMARLLAEE